MLLSALRQPVTLYATFTSSPVIQHISMHSFKLTRISYFLLLLFCFVSCDKKLKEVTVKTGGIEVTKYEISEITTSHDFIEVRKGNSAMIVAETNAHGFTDIIIRHDTIVIQYLPTVFYKTVDKAFGYKIILDTTISVDYWRQKLEQRQKLKR